MDVPTFLYMILFVVKGDDFELKNAYTCDNNVNRYSGVDPDQREPIYCGGLRPGRRQTGQGPVKVSAVLGEMRPMRDDVFHWLNRRLFALRRGKEQ
jgi:hypothetical protein